MRYEWEKKFETEFKTLLKVKDDKETKIIIGQEPYKYSFPKGTFRVESTKYPYSNIDNTVSFFVEDWIKIQDSLEMIFNLLFRDNVNSLKVLTFLRKHKVKANEFADYLFKNYRFIFVNKKAVDGKSNLNKINSVLEKEARGIYLLLVGSEISQIKGFKGDIKDRIEFIHSSGINIYFNSEKYYEDWYEYKDKSTNLEKFRIFNDISLE